MNDAREVAEADIAERARRRSTSRSCCSTSARTTSGSAGTRAGAQHIPMGDVPARMAEIDPDATLYVVCHVGGRSLRVAQYLARNGYEPINVTGGMLAWAGAGRAVVTDDGSAGTV